MLPAESLADVVSFLPYYDLVGLKLSNKLFSAVATQCAKAIRLFDFSDFTFNAYNSCITVWRFGPDGRSSLVDRLELTSESNLAIFILEALRNCAIGRFGLARCPEHVLNAIKVVANTTTVGRLVVSERFAENLQEFFEFAGSFRRVEV